MNHLSSLLTHLNVPLSIEEMSNNKQAKDVDLNVLDAIQQQVCIIVSPHSSNHSLSTHPTINLHSSTLIQVFAPTPIHT